MQLRIDTGSGVHSNGYVIGLADSSKIGATPTASDIDYGFKIIPGILGGTDGLRVEVVSNGTTIALIDDGSQGFQRSAYISQSDGYGNLNRNNEDYCPFWFTREEGSTDLKLYFRYSLVHTFTGVSSNLIPSFYMGGNGNHMRLDALNELRTDTIIELGSPAWRQDADFYAIDLTNAGRPRADEVKLNGVPVTTLYINDRSAVLAAGEVDILSNGVVRYNAADAGKTLTIDRYNVLLHE